MSSALFLLLPALVVVAQDSGIPGAVEVRSGVFVLRGAPDEQTCVAMKSQHITHVIDLRRDGDPNMNTEWESNRLQGVGIQYMRYAISTRPPAGDLDFLRQYIRELPRGARVLLHCGDGNRAAAVACTWLIMDKGMPLEEAMRISKSAGLQRTDTEEAVRRYVGQKG